MMTDDKNELPIKKHMILQDRTTKELCRLTHHPVDEKFGREVIVMMTGERFRYETPDWTPEVSW
jgi:hypothetical protein